MTFYNAMSYPGFILLATLAFSALLLRSERLRIWADVVCCGLLGAFIHFLLLQYGSVRPEEWEILSAFVLVLGFSFVGWSVTRTGVQPTRERNLLNPISSCETTRTQEEIFSPHDERLKTMGMMSARFVHEFSQPLSVMMLRIEEIKRSRTALDEKSLDKAFQSLDAQLRHLMSLSKALKQFSSSDDQIHRGFVSLNEVIELTKSLCDVGVLTRQIGLRWPQQIPNIEISGGCTLHAQILLNLINNAVDSVSELPAEESRWIALEIVENAGEIEIAVCNAGQPIQGKLRSALFRPFFSTKRMGQGLGLGLSTCQQLVHSVGGEIWYDEKAQYPRFVVRYSSLPCVSDLTTEQAHQTPTQIAQRVA